MNGLSLFTGIGGIDVALSGYATPVAYCEIEPYCQSILLQRMQEGNLPKAPIWDDIRTLPANELPRIDIIYGGFPCQDISVAGRGAGLEGERSGLFYEIMRLVKELRPRFVFLENVPAIRTRGLDKVLQELTQERYDCRWLMLSAAEVGALHKRERWFLLAHAGCSSEGRKDQSERTPSNAARRSEEVANSNKTGLQEKRPEQQTAGIERESLLAYAKSFRTEQNISRLQQKSNGGGKRKMAYPECEGLEGQRTRTKQAETPYARTPRRSRSWFEQVDRAAQPELCVLAHEVSNRVGRLKALGNSVVPIQVRTAFELLMFGET